MQTAILNRQKNNINQEAHFHQLCRLGLLTDGSPARSKAAAILASAAAADDDDDDLVNLEFKMKQDNFDDDVMHNIIYAIRKLKTLHEQSVHRDQ
jgi:hypothetical protein